MKTAEYWANRFTALDDESFHKTERYIRNVTKQFIKAKTAFEKDMLAWYTRVAENNDISLAEAKKLLRGNELEEFKWTVEEYIRHGRDVDLNPEWIKQLENASARVHINRLQSMELQMRQQVEMLYKEYETGVAEHLSSTAQDSYYHTAYELAKGTGVGVNLHRLDTDSINTMLTKPWCSDGKVFSDRIWTQKDDLVSTLNTLLTQNIITGKDPQKSINALTKRFDVAQSKAGRLIMTETAAIQNESRRKCMNELGVEEYEIVATLDSHTSAICQSMDGQHFKMSEFKEGVTAPPFHCNCRSCTVPYFEDEFTVDETRAARDGDDGRTYQVPSNMKYEDWNKAFVQGDKSGFTKTVEPLSGRDVWKYDTNHSDRARSEDLYMSAKSGNISVEEVNIPRSSEIKSFTDTEQINQLFPEVEFDDSFANMSFESQKEVAQGLNYMRSVFGQDAMPRRIKSIKGMKDYAAYDTITKTMKFRSSLEAGNSLVAACHESVHVLDGVNGNIAKDIIRQAYKQLGVRYGGRDADRLLVNSIGIKLFTKYKNDFAEQLAWSFESSLYSMNDKLGNEIRKILIERFGV